MSDSSPARTWRLGRGLVLTAALIYGVLPGIIDLFTPQHLGDPDWTGHRRFHLIWQIFLVGYLGLRGFWLAWQADTPHRLDLIERSAGHGLIVLAAFGTAGLLAGPLGASFGEPDQVLLGIPFPILHFSSAALVLFAGTLLCRRASKALDPAGGGVSGP